jgi:hypothetical protein
MVPSVNVYDKVEDIDFLFNSCDLTVPFEWTAKWNNNAQTMIDIIKAEWKS